MIHRNGVIEYRGKKETDWDDLEVKHEMEMKKLENLVVGNKPAEEPKKSKSYNLVFLGRVLDGMQSRQS